MKSLKRKVKTAAHIREFAKAGLSVTKQSAPRLFFPPPARCATIPVVFG